METLLAEVISYRHRSRAARPASAGDDKGAPAAARWRVLQQIGEGGMGSIWEVEHVELGRRAALKTPHLHHRGRSDVASRLRDEARALARVRHPGIPDVLDLGVLDDGRPYFVMEHVRGSDLRTELTRHGVLSVPTAVRMVIGLLDALEAVHGASLVHRDVKLENLVMRDDGRLALIDFGLALRMDDDLRRTGRGRAVGTPRTMSPEQHARGAVDQRTDLYAVGLCLFELIAGSGPFDDARTSLLGMHRAHCERTPPRLGDVAPQLVPIDLEEVTRRALAKAPEDRFESAASMREALLQAGTRPRQLRWESGESPFAETVLSASRHPYALLDLASLVSSGPTWDVTSSELEAV